MSARTWRFESSPRHHIGFSELMTLPTNHMQWITPNDLYHATPVAIKFLMVIGIVFSLIFGLFCFAFILDRARVSGYSNCDWRKWFNVDKKYTAAHFIYQFWSYFIGSFIGWLVCILLYIHFANLNWKIESVTINQIILLLIGLLGISGHLAFVLWAIAQSTVKIGAKALELVAEK